MGFRLFIISLSRKLQIIDSKCFSMLIKKIYNILNLEMIKENSFNIYFKAKENSFYLKEALINKAEISATLELLRD